MKPQPPDMARVQSLAIVKLGAIGDVVHALPVSAALKQAFPHVELTWIVEPMSAPMVEGNPYLSDVFVVPSEWKTNRLSAQSLGVFLALRRELRARRFDVALDLQGLSKTALITWATGARHRYGYDWIREIAPLLETRVPRRPESLHIVEQLLDVARFLGAQAPQGAAEFPLVVPEEEEARARELLAEAGVEPARPYVVVNPSIGGGGYKGWPPERFAELLDRMAEAGQPPAVLIGSPGDLDVAEALCRRAARPIASLVGRTNLKQLIAVLRGAALHVAGDTGSAHVAAAVGTPVVAIFGRTDPVKLAPYGFERFAVHHRECCAPKCRHFHATTPINRKQKCLTPPPACLAAVTVDEVAAAVTRALTERRVDEWMSG